VILKIWSQVLVSSQKYARYVPKIKWYFRYIASIFLTRHKRLWSDVDKLFQGLKSSTKGNNSLKKGALFLIIISLWIQIFSLNFMVLVSIKYINLHEIHYQNRVEIYMTNCICYLSLILIFKSLFRTPKLRWFFWKCK
jgi:hypothetical protein